MEGAREKIEVKLRKRTAAAASSFAQAWGFYTSHTHTHTVYSGAGAGGGLGVLGRWTKLFALVKRQQTWPQLQWHKRNITNLHKMLNQREREKETRPERGQTVGAD